MLLHEDEVDGRYQTGEGGEVVPGQMLLKADNVTLKKEVMEELGIISAAA